MQTAPSVLARSTQMNVRLNSDIKAAGDRALASIGVTPTQAVRSLWEHLAAAVRNPRDVERLLSFGDGRANGSESSPVSSAGHDLAVAGAMQFAKTLADMGVDPTIGASGDFTDEELLESALMDRLDERGFGL